MRSQSIKTKVQLKIPNWLRLRLNVNSVIINKLKHICTHQSVISVKKRQKDKKTKIQKNKKTKKQKNKKRLADEISDAGCAPVCF